MEANALHYATGASQLLRNARRFTILRAALERAPMRALTSLLTALIEGEVYTAAEEYHALSAALIEGGYRRVSGNLLHDYILHLLLEEENAFSALAAQGVWDEPLAAAMRIELILLTPFFDLSSSVLKRWLKEASRDEQQKPRSPKDKIAMLSSAVWSGGAARPVKPAPDYIAPPRAHVLLEQDFISWVYKAEQELLPPYVADETLMELYRRLINAEDKSRLLDDIWHFHSVCGTGVFLRHRVFAAGKDGALTPIALAADMEAFSLYHKEREQQLKNVIRFMRDESADNMLITGMANAGKTSQIFALARELPALRMVFCTPDKLCTLYDIVPALLKQPFKFMLFLDDFENTSPAWHGVRALLSPAGLQPDKLLIAAAARECDDAFFSLHIHLSAPQLKEFIELVQILLIKMGCDMDFDAIQNACIDYAAATGKNGAPPLSFRAAKSIAQTLTEDM